MLLSIPRARTLRIVVRLGIFLFCLSAITVLAFHLLTPRSQTAGNPDSQETYQESSRQHGAIKPDGPDRISPAMLESYGQLPLSFEFNRGQTNTEAKFFARGNGYGLFLTSTGAVFRFFRPDQPGDASKTGTPGANARSGASVETLRMRFKGARAVQRPLGLGVLPGKSNYFIGNNRSKWQTNVPLYSKILYPAIYPGIDLVYYGNQRELEYDLVVAPGASPERIRMTFDRADKIEVDSSGDLLLTNRTGTIRHRRPFAYQEIAGTRKEIEAAYVVEKGEVGFEIGNYDRTKPLNIDPVLVYSSFLGGAMGDQGLAIAVDAQGSAYLTGLTASTNFPLASPLQSTKEAANDAFVVKLNPAGTALVYATYLGGNGDDSGNAIAVDSEGNAYVTGLTGSGSFPRTIGAFQDSKDGFTDAFAVKLNPSGSDLVYSTFIGGDNNDNGLSIAVDNSNRAVIVGRTDSTRFRGLPLPRPRSGNPLYLSSNAGGLWSASSNGLTASAISCLTQAPSSATTLYACTNAGIFKTDNGGSTWAPLTSQLNAPLVANTIVVDPSNPNILYAATSAGVFKSTNGGQSFVQKNNGLVTLPLSALAIDPNAPSVLYTANQFGLFKTTDGAENWVQVDIGLGPFSIRASKIALDPSSTPASTIYLGTTNRGMLKSTNGGSTWTEVNNGLSSFASINILTIDPVDPSILYAGASGLSESLYKTTNGGASWSPSGSGLTFTFEGQVINLSVISLAIDPTNRNNLYAGTSVAGIYKTNDSGATWGQSNSGFININATTFLVDRTNGSNVFAGTNIGSDAFAIRLTTTGNLDYFLNFGGDETDEARGVAVDASDNAYITGTTNSNNLPVTNAFQAAYGGFTDAFVGKLNSNGSAFNYLTYLGGSVSDQGRGIAIRNGSAYVTGSTISSNFPAVNGFRGAPANFDQDAFVTKFNAAGNGLDFSTFLGGQSIDLGSAIAVDQNGSVFVTGTTSSSDFPIFSAPQPVLGGNFSNDAFVTKLTPSGNAIVYSTYLGGSNTDQGNGIAVDASGNAYVTGNTSGGTFPTIGSLQNFGGGTDAFVAKLGAAADLVVSITGTPNPTIYGNNLTYTIAITNSGEIRAENVTLSNTLLSGTGVVSINPTQGTCSGNRFITCNLSLLDPGATATVTLVVLPPAVVTMTESAVVSSNTPDSNQANNTATLNTPVVFTDIMVKNSSALQFTEIGAVNTYIVTVTNKGPAAATSITVTNNLPAETTFVACSAPQSAVCGGSGNNRTVTIPSLAVGASITATISASINNSVTPGTIISDTASLISTVPDINPNNDAQTAFTTARVASGPVQNGLIAFQSDGGTGISGAIDIYITNSDSTGQTNITSEDAQENTQPVWSPDGTKIAYIARGFPSSGVWVMNADGSGKAKVTTSLNSLNDQSPTWSPDGSRIAFGAFREGNSFGVFVINTDGTQLKKLVNGNDPSWSPDGTRIAFGNGFGIGMMYSDGSDVRNISLPKIPLPGFGWSPDSSKLVVSLQDQNFGTSLFIVNADGTGLAEINNTKGGAFPTWSPDGTKILFSRSQQVSEPDGCFFINLDGTGLTRVDGELPSANRPSWQRRPPNSNPLPPTINISGRVTNTADGSSVPLDLTLSGTLSRTTHANANGDYHFWNVPSGGNYTVTPILNFGATSNPTNRVFNGVTTNQTNADFAITFPPRPPVTGNVKDFNGVPLANVRVGIRNSIPNVDTFTDANGNFSFPNVFVGFQGFLIPIPEANFANYTFEPQILFIQNLSGNNFVGRPRTASISGTVTVGGVGQPGVSVFSQEPQFLSTVTDANGNYTLSGVGEGATHVVRVNTQTFPFTPTQQTVTVNGQKTGVNFAAPLNQFIISGQVASTGGGGIEGVTVTLGGATNATTQTSANGTFSFGLLQGNASYTVSIAKSGFTFQSSVANIQNLTSNTQLAFSGFQNTLQFSVNNSNVRVNETDGSVTLNVVRNGFVTDTLKVDFSTSNGTATQRTDYTATLGTLTFAPQEFVKTIVIPINDDSYVEGDEFFTVTLTNPANAFIGDLGSILITVQDDDTATPVVNPLDSAPFFVRQHYHDFLSRVPDTSGLTFWSEQITDCGIDVGCKDVRRINGSAAFFLSIEFQETGYLVERLYKSAYGDAVGTSNFGPTHQLPVPVLRFDEFLVDTQMIGKGLIVGQTGWEQVLENNKTAFVQDFVSRPRFVTAHPTTMTPDQFVDQLFANTGVTPLPNDRALAINEFGGAANTIDNAARARALRRVAENSTFKQQEKSRAFVLMQYFGYLRRNPNDPQDTDYTGYDFWLTKLNEFNGNFINAEMVKAFIDSREYRERFGP